MKTFRTLSCFMLCGMLMVQYASSQAFRNAGSSGMQFLKIGVGARAMGMGGAFSSTIGDAAALAWNPAGIGTISNIALSVQHTPWIAGVDHNFAGIVLPVTPEFNLGLHVINLSSGNIDITTIDDPLGTGEQYTVSDVAVGLTSSVRLTSQLTFATTVKYIQETIYDLVSGGVAIDAGMSYATGYRSLHVGFAISNLGFEQHFTGRQLEVRYVPSAASEPPVKAELQSAQFTLPLQFRASGAFDLLTMFDEPSPQHSIRCAVEFIQHSDIREQLVLGAEYQWEQALSLRSGYIVNSDELSWSSGLGYAFALSGVECSLDYAVNDLGRFGLGQRFGVSFMFY
ncbi:MAG: PorV/PorQ family protein [Bacteroidetes bacterium]|nr:PorV/PorQ family protein [Bacteroidota bacterium]